MKSYYRKIFIYILAALAVTLVFLLVNSGVLVTTSTQDILFQTADYQPWCSTTRWTKYR